ncbi:hypothetical protein H257_08146 [Aphanomyces astaci]|uniref:Uncharacterized protein n=1 Tax=Aphanomyces astaci TaxID=112090 RepID=W4GG64_APHAT|nr:hypothetical protein H257_08146 [Aphanomyces astaci]ETV78655.1 hypothetical protein H257_08146 [Aphanomyces astaci]|eukprot:XP_009832236.1 hypothetical protein H257_08146 [Aphanomyces astaci]
MLWLGEDEAEAILAFRGPGNTAYGSPVVTWAMSSGHPGVGVSLDGLRYSSWWKREPVVEHASVLGVPEELLAVFQEAAAKGKAESFLTGVLYLSTVVEYAEMFFRRLELQVDGELYTDFGIGAMALHFSDIVSGEALEEVFVTFPVTLHGAEHDRLAIVV